MRINTITIKAPMPNQAHGGKEEIALGAAVEYRVMLGEDSGTSSPATFKSCVKSV